jgi:hypothetical protein
VLEVAYTLTPIMEGVVHFSGEAPHLQFQKTSFKDGHFDLQIQSDGDSVYLAVNALRIEATRGKRTVTIGTNGASSEELANARALLAGSRAVKQYRRLASALEASRSTSQAAYAVLIGAAVVDTLEGDIEASARIARRLSSIRGSGFGVPSQLRGIRWQDCWSQYEQGTASAMDDYVGCLGRAAHSPWWFQYEYFEGCTIAWAIRAEGYWFNWMACSALPPTMS